MKQKFFFTISSLFLGLTIFVGAPVSQVFASESDYGIENQQKSKQVIIEIRSDKIPPKVIFHKTNDGYAGRSEEHTSELQSRGHLVCRLLLEKKNQISTVLTCIHRDIHITTLARNK